MAIPTERPRLRFWQIWNMSFGFLGIQFGWGLQMANMSAIYEYLGASPTRSRCSGSPRRSPASSCSRSSAHMSDRTWGRARPPPSVLPGRRDPQLARARR